MIDITETINQLGGGGLSGALTYCGVSQMSVDNEPNKLNDGMAFFKVNGKPGYKWFIAVILDYNDTYTVKLLQKRGRNVETLDSRSSVYCDELKETFETMYDNGINKFNRGFIPLGKA